jgi:co-chaperonin GroES (HSP10)
MIKLKRIKPMFTAIITTMDRYENDVVSENGLIDTTRQKGSIKEYQRVLAVGDLVKSLKEGDLVCINPSRYAIKKHQEGSLKDGVITDNPVISYNFDVIEMDNEQCLLLQDRDISYIVEEYEETPDNPSQIYVPNKEIIV